MSSDASSSLPWAIFGFKAVAGISAFVLFQRHARQTYRWTGFTPIKVFGLSGALWAYCTGEVLC